MYRRLPGAERAGTRAPPPNEQQGPSTLPVHRAETEGTSEPISDYTPSELYYVVIHLLHNPPVEGHNYSWLPQSQKTQLYNVFLELSNDDHQNVFTYIANRLNDEPGEPPDMSTWKAFIEDKFAQGYAQTVDDVVRRLYPMPIRSAGKSKRKGKKGKKRKSYRVR